jgi:hypothetical protein
MGFNSAFKGLRFAVSEEISVELRMLERGQNKLQKQNKVSGMERTALILTIG